ncbi:MAG: hypothetical protein LBO09_08870 [Candidatus Peribacteria bacterium]|jgi:hypothetical protein|nr:hypothetical protein [Candidatus Peribacteria bacterium]
MKTRNGFSKQQLTKMTDNEITSIIEQSLEKGSTSYYNFIHNYHVRESYIRDFMQGKSVERIVNEGMESSLEAWSHEGEGNLNHSTRPGSEWWENM